MDYVKFGNTGLDVSPLCLGTMGFGDPNSGFHEWVLEEDDSREVIKKALDLGINFFDTANVYSYGASEEIVGRALNDFAPRDEIVVATKLYSKMKQRPNSGGLSRKAIFYQVEQSLKRLQMDYIDLYIIHRWDYHTPIEETMKALHDLVVSGKVRYIGASAMYAWQFAKAQAVAEKNGWTKFVSMQNHLNLLYREEEREMMPLCADQKIAVTPYSPLAAGRLTRDWGAETKRYLTDKTANQKYDKTMEQDREIVVRVAQIADKHQSKRAQIALAWLLQKEQVVAPIIGATKESHLLDALPALDLKLTAEEIAYLEEPYLPHAVVGAE
ncbi:aldo/keto reductase [Enterococcus casseliflavus]|uniref:aldo/keto reductase n=1 Tax=Enterococcus casseliflavus TaxID=37734 RepID=UPI0009C0B6B6|nr:aldo/keto reductase [Enterococcus casseliflavus]MDV7736414.1 aldo/keto reductase [Enterococcus casseliflavus]OQO84768.1 oxidoreductase [Enterococcus casseliflavus]QQU15637.1 aldo/keto reductase [Enterococcus casseliflavus]UQZ97035.1 aldo/keto reductase [Enterococcus casseliflavus]